MSPDIALLPLIEDWVETYQETANDEVSERTSVHELVLFLIRCCGLSADLDEDEAMDTDGVVDVLERIQDETVKVGDSSHWRVDMTDGEIDESCDLPIGCQNQRSPDVANKSQPPHSPFDQNTISHTSPLPNARDNLAFCTHHSSSTQLASLHVLLTTPSYSTHVLFSDSQDQLCLVRSGSWRQL